MTQHRKLMMRELAVGVVVALVVSVVLGVAGMFVTLELVKAKNTQQDEAITSTAGALADLARDLKEHKDRVADRIDVIGRDVSYIRGLMEQRAPAGR